jgi:hypothetical protein
MGIIIRNYCLVVDFRLVARYSKGALKDLRVVELDSIYQPDVASCSGRRLGITINWDSA